MVSIKLCQGLNRNWIKETQKEKSIKTAIIPTRPIIQLNVSEYSWDCFYFQSVKNCLYFQRGQLQEVIYLSAVDWKETWWNYISEDSFPFACGNFIKEMISLIAFCHRSYSLSSSLSPPRSSFLFLAPLVLRFSWLPPAVDGNTWAQVIALYPTLVECITCSSSEVSSALKEALGPFKDFMQPPVSRVQNGESWPGWLWAPWSFFMMKKSLNVSSRPTCFKSARTWTPCETHLRWHEAPHSDDSSEVRPPPFICIIVCFSCELIMPLPPPPLSYRLAALLC